ncbi:MAG: RnfABCDGE type electron transport complex subunit D [Gammaproteobacteria bacterium]|nr:RnfABCDGE type electron transport complex subunit D [Gammaproteobacteria bacterium]
MDEIQNISPPHIHSQASVNEVMQQVIFALVPGIIVCTWILGWGVLVHCLLAVSFALAFEAIMLKLRKRPLQVFLFDRSAIITGLLFALTITPFAPWWVTLSGLCFAIVIAKHLYGGLGYNIFNPAMAGYVFVLICFPVELNHWPIVNDNPGLIESLRMIFSGLPAERLDSLSGATPLAFTKSQLSGMAMLSEFSNGPLFGALGGKGWEWIGLAFLAGGIWLIIKGIIKWQIPLVMIFTLFLLSLIFHGYDPDRYASSMFNLFTGGTLLAAFFIATDPVTASATPRGIIIYAAGIGILTYIIRTWGSYPDGIAFAVLIMNAAVPFIDSITRPDVFGEVAQ